MCIEGLAEGLDDGRNEGDELGKNVGITVGELVGFFVGPLGLVDGLAEVLRTDDLELRKRAAAVAGVLVRSSLPCNGLRVRLCLTLAVLVSWRGIWRR